MFGFPLVPEGQVVVVQVGSPVEEVVASDGSVVQRASSRVAGDLCRPPRDGWRRVGALPQRDARTGRALGLMAAPVDLPMPKLGDTVTEGTVIEWLRVGGRRRDSEGQTLAEITTDKVTTDYPSPCSGTVVALLLDVDETVPVGTPMVRIETDDVVVLDESASKPAPVEPTPVREALRATGTARATAKATGIDVTALAGTGRHGRVVEADVVGAAPRARVDPMRRAMARHMEQSWAQSRARGRAHALRCGGSRAHPVHFVV